MPSDDHKLSSTELTELVKANLQAACDNDYAAHVFDNPAYFLVSEMIEHGALPPMKTRAIAYTAVLAWKRENKSLDPNPGRPVVKLPPPNTSDGWLITKARELYEQDPPDEVEGDTWDTLSERGTERDREILDSYLSSAWDELEGEGS